MKIYQSNLKKNICIISGIYILISFLFQLIDSISYFPNNYSCREWLINYSGGFIRRGLWGQILLILDDYIAAPYLIFTLVFISFCFVTIALFKAIAKYNKISLLLAVILITNPISIRFYLLDEICARKDIFCLAIFFLIILVIKKIFESSTTPKYLVYSSMVFYILAIFLHELSLFFLFPLFSFLYLKNLIDKKYKTKILLFILIYIATIAIFIVLMPQSTNKNIEQTIYKISNSWHDKYNNSFIYYKDIKDGPELGMHYTLKQTMQRSYNSLTFSKRIVFDTFLMLIFLESIIYIFLKKLSAKLALTRYQYILTMLLLNMPVLICIFADDFSRWFSLTFITDLFIFINLDNTDKKELNSKLETISIYKLFLVLFIGFFMSLFTIENWPILLKKFIRYSNVGALLFINY